MADMPEGKNWQGDVLRDLRGAAAAPQAATQPQSAQPSAPAAEPRPAQTPGPAAQPAQHPAPAQGGYEAAQPQPQPRTQPFGPSVAAGQSPYAPGARQVRTPDSRPVVDKDLAAVSRRPQHGEPLLSRVAGVLRRTLSSSTARDVAAATHTASILQQPVTTGRQIAVTSIRGGSGKSTVAALLGMVYAHHRQDPVLLVEADPSLGSLPLRLGAEALRWTTSELPAILQPQMSLLDVTGYLVQLPDNAWLLPGSQGQVGAMLDSRTYEAVMVALRRYFGVTVVDCETLPAEVARVALSAAQSRVLTAPATLEGLTSTHSVLQWIRKLPPSVIAGTVVALTEQAPRPGIDVQAAARKLEETGASVQVIPYDRHLAAGGAIRTGLLAHSTREAAGRLAAVAFQLSQNQR